MSDEQVKRAEPESDESIEAGSKGALRRSLLLSSVVLAAGGGAAWWFYQNRPVAAKGAGRKKRAAPAVTVLKAERGKVTLRVDALGTVESTEKVSLRSRVAGTIVSLDKQDEELRQAVAAAFEAPA
ncbi:MAG: hypothetical protein HUK26_08760, partial [Duodenibacillus sp.]|nr:hypothetical protein [Duodenibacillus sp.]